MAGAVGVADSLRPRQSPGIEKKDKKNQIVAASFGDEVFDVEMLKEAKVAVAIRPKARLRGRASEITGLVELERRL